MKKTLVVSLDALGAEDYDLFIKQPNISAVIANGSFLSRVKSVNPTLTYPAHTTITSGRYPSSHGIVNNIKVQPKRNDADWYWYEREIQGDTLFRAACRSNKRVGAIFWPVCAGLKVQWNMAEIWPHRKWQNQAMVSLLNSTPAFATRMAKKYGYILQGTMQPYLDEFAYACAQEVLQENWDLLFVHFTDIDAHKHRYGNRAPEVEESIRRTDERVGGLIRTIEEKGLLPYTNIILLSDHSQRDITHTLRMNQIFYKHGLLNAHNGSVTRYRAYVNTAVGLAHIYTDGQPSTLQFVRELLEDIQKNYPVIERIYTKKEAVAMGSDPKCSFMVTAKPGYTFSNELEGEVYGAVDAKYKANHGYRNDLPHYEAIFCGYGPSFKSGVQVDEVVEMIDLGPTIAEAAGIFLHDPQGAVRWDILE